MSEANHPRLGAWRIVPAAVVFLLAACSEEKAGDFTYNCVPGGGMFDGRSCDHRLGGKYLLRYGEGSGDHIVLALDLGDGASVGLLGQLDDEDVVEAIGLDDQVLVARTRQGHLYAAPARSEKWPEVVGPLTSEEFAARYPNAPAWKAVQ